MNNCREVVIYLVVYFGRIHRNLSQSYKLHSLHLSNKTFYALLRTYISHLDVLQYVGNAINIKEMLVVT